MSGGSLLRLSVVVPAHQGGPDLDRCLTALSRSNLVPHEVLVVSNGRCEAPLEAARRFGFQALKQPLKGPAAARNLGAAAATGEVLVFIDSDVEVSADTLGRLEFGLREHPDADAIFGSYDDAPVHRNVCSLYVNLRHHYVHQRSRRETGTFWSGCGAIRRSVFLELEGFATSYLEPSIEDIELGMRLHASGRRARLHPEIQVTHSKHWTLGALLISDIFRRALPWTRKLLESRSLPPVLNLDWSSRLSALAAWLAVLGVTVLSGKLALLSLLMIGVLNAGLFALFVRRGGLAKGLACVGLHLLYLLYSSATFAIVALVYRVASRRTSPQRTAQRSGS